MQIERDVQPPRVDFLPQDLIYLGDVPAKSAIAARSFHHVQHDHRPRFEDYVDERQIERTDHFSYYFDDKMFDNETLFLELGKKTTAEISLQVSSLYEATRGYRNQRNPNLATYFIRFHLRNSDGEQYAVLFQNDGVYVSSALTFFPGKESKFKIKNNFKLAFHDFLNRTQKEKYFSTSELRSVHLRELMFDNISRYVVGPWYYNAIDSEALIFLDLLDNKLASYLSAIEAGSTIEGIVIGIKSLYQSCYRCGNLMQGFQRAMHQRLRVVGSSGDAGVRILRRTKRKSTKEN